MESVQRRASILVLDRSIHDFNGLRARPVDRCAQVNYQ